MYRNSQVSFISIYIYLYLSIFIYVYMYVSIYIHIFISLVCGLFLQERNKVTKSVWYESIV